MNKKNLVLRIFFALTLIVTVGACAAWGYYDAVMASFQDSSNGISIANDSDDLISDDEIINILVVGSDRRENENESERSDSTMIATLDMKTKSIKITSLMRDMYIDIPDHGMDKFNSSYSYGGVELLAQTITTNFGIKLDGYVIVDFSSFKKVINEIGGVEIELIQEEVDYLNNTGEEDTGFILSEKHRTLEVGKNTLNGAQALAYSRIRKVTNPELGDGDFGRCMRQQYVIRQILKKIKHESTTEILGIATSLMSDVSTDLNSSMVQRLVRTVMNLDVSDIESLRLPYEDTYYMTRRNGMFVFIINLEANKAKLQNFIYGIGDDDADYANDFGEVTESDSDSSSGSDSYYEDDSDSYNSYSSGSSYYYSGDSDSTSPADDENESTTPAPESTTAATTEAATTGTTTEASTSSSSQN